MADRHAHCGSCGVRFESSAWPRTCRACKAITYLNPAPVVVVLQQVDEGLLVVRRAIEPRKDHWALPGGYVDHGESWQAAAARELDEETGIDASPDGFELFDAHSTPTGAEVLLFAVAPLIESKDLPTFIPRDEVSELDVIREPRELAFPLHTRMCEAFFSREGD